MVNGNQTTSTARPDIQRAGKRYFQPRPLLHPRFESVGPNGCRPIHPWPVGEGTSSQTSDRAACGRSDSRSVERSQIKRPRTVFVTFSVSRCVLTTAIGTDSTRCNLSFASRDNRQMRESPLASPTQSMQLANPKPGNPVALQQSPESADHHQRN